MISLEPKTCPVVNCQPGYKKIVKDKKATKSQRYHSFITPMMAGSVKTKAGSSYTAIKAGYKGGNINLTQYSYKLINIIPLHKQ